MLVGAKRCYMRMPRKFQNERGQLDGFRPSPDHTNKSHMFPNEGAFKQKYLFPCYYKLRLLTLSNILLKSKNTNAARGGINDALSFCPRTFSLYRNSDRRYSILVAQAHAAIVEPSAPAGCRQRTRGTAPRGLRLDPAQVW